MKILDQIPIREFASDWGIVSANIALATISAVAAVSAARSARAALRRETPIFEVVRKDDYPWPDWTGIQLYVTNPAQADIVIERISVPFARAGRIEIIQRLMVSETGTVRGWVSRDVVEQVRRKIPISAPETAGTRHITDLKTRIASFRDRRTLIELTSPPDKNGKPIVPSALVIRYRWRDQRNRLIAIKAHT